MIIYTDLRFSLRYSRQFFSTSGNASTEIIRRGFVRVPVPSRSLPAPAIPQLTKSQIATVALWATTIQTTEGPHLSSGIAESNISAVAMQNESKSFAALYHSGFRGHPRPARTTLVKSEAVANPTCHFLGRVILGFNSVGGRYVYEHCLYLNAARFLSNRPAKIYML